MSSGVPESTANQCALLQSLPSESRLVSEIGSQHGKQPETKSQPHLEAALSTEEHAGRYGGRCHGQDRLQRSQTACDDVNNGLPIEPLATTASAASPVYSVFTKNQKRFIVFMAAWAGFFSPVSGNIYFPALNPLARDLNVSNTLINLTLTSYMVRPHENMNTKAPDTDHSLL